ncbi:MAG: bifunctional UDP-N-acetylglucosamine diphosphorylase/glucosamine-1-phosphate N-acetyltransferase GlmU [Anaerolineales bacterium]|jgi:bifunctional UDP-N-acetylglucosamine pyrophosphorylase/glucosamine-1-phosphate N-acetyltransferase
MKTTVVLLAAGKGTRMRSKVPKVLHPLAGRPLIWHALSAIKEFSDTLPVVVVGEGAEAVKETVGDAAQFVVQVEQLGTGHAVLQAKELLEGKSDYVIVVNADLPMISKDTLQRLLDIQKDNPGPLTLLTVMNDNPRGFGRILRNDSGHVTAIVEEVDCTPEQASIKELNVGVYCFQADWLWENLPKLPLSSNKEYFLTDTIGLASSAGQPVKAHVLEDPAEAMGINTRVHLAEAEAILRERINSKWMLAGVTIIDPHTTYISMNASIGEDTILYPNTFLEGDTHIGEDCRIGPNAILRDSQVGNHCEITASMIESAKIEDHVDIGPFGHLRKGAHLAEGVHMGNFGEVKNATLGPGVKMGHFSYIGDATIGKNVNIGAGTITANYDGKQKHHTTIEDNVFIGSDTMLIAPLKIGKGASTGAGSVVNKDVEENMVVVGIPARAIRKKKRSD